jgi:plasmid maintenance system killer protein
VIRTFSDKPTEKIFGREELTRKEIRAPGLLNIQKAYDRLQVLHLATERDHLAAVSLHYHGLGKGRYSIDADSRKSPWCITFECENEELTNVKLVKIENTH